MEIVNSLAELRKLTRHEYKAHSSVCRYSEGRTHTDTRALKNAVRSFSALDHEAMKARGVDTGLTIAAIRPMVRMARREIRTTERQDRIKHLAGRSSGPVYFWHYSRDCDLMESSHPVAYANRMIADEDINSSYDGAEGPMSFTPITAEEYEECKGEYVFRDIAAEQMNY